MRRLRWVLIALSSLSLAGSRTLAYDLNIAGIPIIDAAIIVMLFASALVSMRRHDLDRRTLFILITLAPVVLIAATESAGQPNEQTLRLLMPFAVFGLALIPSQMSWQRSELRWLLGLPVVIHFALNLLYLIINGPDPGSTGIDQIRDIAFPNLSRADGLGLIYGFGLLALADLVAARSRLRAPTAIAVMYLAIAGQVAWDHKALLLAALTCALLALTQGLFDRNAGERKIGVAAVTAVVIGFFAAPIVASWQLPQSVPQATPTTTQATPTTTQATSIEATNPPGLLERFVIQGSETSRIDTWGDILRATDGPSRFLIGGNSSDTNLLLTTCGLSRTEYEQSSSRNKCAVDNGFADFPLQFAHNWVFTSYLYFGIIGVASLMVLLYLSLRDSAAVFRVTPIGAAPAVFWLIGLTSVMLWSPFVLTHAAVATLAVNSLAHQTKVETPDT